MDGNFIDNDFENIIVSAGLEPEDYAEAPRNEKSGPLNLLSKYDKFSLRIKFSRGLDPNSVNAGSAVLSSGNKKVKTNVSYDNKRRSIIISPKSAYLRNTLYYLKLSGRVMTENGRSLRENRFFVFKQDGKSLDFYKSPKAAEGQSAPETIYVPKNFVLPVLFAASAIVIILSYFYSYKAGIIFGTALVLISTGLAVIDSVSDIGKSSRECAYGAKLYNNGYYFEAMECFELALHFNPDNIYAQAGLDAAIIMLSKTGG